MWKATHRTSERTSVERLGYFLRLLFLELWAVKWELCTAESWVAAAHPVYSHLTVHLWTGTVAHCTSCLLCYCGCHWYEWTDTPRFLLRSSDKIHSCKLKACGKVCRHLWMTLIHNECRICRSLYLLSSFFACVYSCCIFPASFVQPPERSMRLSNCRHGRSMHKLLSPPSWGDCSIQN